MLSDLSFQFHCRQHNKALDGWPGWTLSHKTDEELLARVPDDFGLTLSGFKCPEAGDVLDFECSDTWYAEITLTAKAIVNNEPQVHAAPAEPDITDIAAEVDYYEFEHDPDVLLDDFSHESDIAEEVDKGLDTPHRGMGE